MKGTIALTLGREYLLHSRWFYKDLGDWRKQLKQILTIRKLEEIASKSLVIRGREFWFDHKGKRQRITTIRLYTINQKKRGEPYAFGEIQYSFPGSWNITHGACEGVSCHPVTLNGNHALFNTDSELGRWKEEEPLWLGPKAVVFTRGINRYGGGRTVPSSDFWFLHHLMRMEMWLKLACSEESEVSDGLIKDLYFKPPCEFLKSNLSQLQGFITQQLKAHERVLGHS